MSLAQLFYAKQAFCRALQWVRDRNRLRRRSHVPRSFRWLDCRYDKGASGDWQSDPALTLPLGRVFILSARESTVA